MHPLLNPGERVIGPHCLGDFWAQEVVKREISCSCREKTMQAIPVPHLITVEF